MYADIDRVGRMSLFELSPFEVKILAESLGHFIDAATSIRSIECGQEIIIRTAEMILQEIRNSQL